MCAIVCVQWAPLPDVGEGAWAAEKEEEVEVGGLRGGGDRRLGVGGEGVGFMLVLV